MSFSASRARSIAGILLALAAAFAGVRFLTRPGVRGISEHGSSISSSGGRTLSQPATGSSDSTAVSPHVNSATILDLDAGKFHVKPVHASDATVTQLQGQLQPVLTTYCLQRPTAKLSFQLADSGGGTAAEQYLSAAESAVLAVLDEIYATHDASQTRSEKLLLNVGSGAGFYTSHAAAAGVDVIAFEPQPACVALQLKSAAANHHEQHVRVLNAGVTSAGGGGHQGTHHHAHHHAHGHGGTFEVHADRCNNSYSIPQHMLNITSSSTQQQEQQPQQQHSGAVGGPGATSVPWLFLRRFLMHRRVHVLKIDVEGAEIRVLDSALEMLWKTLDYVVVRITRHRWAEHDVTYKHGDSALQAMTYGARRVVHVDALSELHHTNHFGADFVDGHTYLFEFGPPVDLDTIRTRHVLTLCS